MIIYASDDPGAVIYIKNFFRNSKHQIKQIKKINSLQNVRNIELVITGASLGNSLDKKLIIKKNKILSISIIEH